MSIKGFLFDCDGTLFFNSDLHTLSMGRIFERDYGLPAPDDHTMITEIFGRTNWEIYRNMISADATDEEAEHFNARKEEEYRNICLEYPERLHLVEGAPELLDYLKENRIPFAMATGSAIDNVRFYFEHLGLSRWFDDNNLLYADGSFPGKPAPDIYILAAKKLGLSPSECVVFEDGTSGIHSAIDAGCGGVVAVYDKRFEIPEKEKSMVDSIHHDMTDWKEILASYGLVR